MKATHILLKPCLCLASLLITFSTLFSAAPAASAPPLSFVGFTASPGEDKAVLRWQAAPGNNTDHYIIGESTDGSHFIEIGNVMSTAGAGADNYNVTITTTISGLHYFRLIALDKAGKRICSQTTTVIINNHRTFILRRTMFAKPGTGLIRKQSLS